MLLLLTWGGGAAVVLIIVAVALRSSGIWRPARELRARPRRPQHSRHRRLSRRGRRRLLFAVGGGSVLVVALLLVEGFNLGRALLGLQKGQVALSDAYAAVGPSPENWTAANVTTAANLQKEAHVQFQVAQQRIADDRGLALLSHVPLAEDQVRALRDGAAGAVAGSSSFADALAVAASVDEARQSADPPGTRLLRLLEASRAPWTDASTRLDATLPALRRDIAGPLLPPLRSRLQTELTLLSPLNSAAHLGAVASRYAPAALGATSPQTYLVLLPNPSEIRPAGGFSGAIGAAVMSGGSPSSIEVRSQDDFNPLMKARQPVPAALGRYLKFYKNGLELGDAGWSPDFPSTARLSESMYASATGKQVDGTISIDPYAVQALLSITGPVDVAPYGTFDSGNFFNKLNLIVNAGSGPASGKQALPPISRAVLSRVLTTPPAAWPRLFGVVARQGAGRHLQAYFHEKALAQAASAARLDGGLLSPGSDFLLVADSNVAINKADYFAHKSMVVRSQVEPALGVVRHEVLVRYEMPLPVSNDDRALNPGDGSFREYIRVYLPKEASVAKFLLGDGSGGTAEGGLDSISLSEDHQVVGAYLRVPRGKVGVVDIIYEVPLLPGSSYGLYIQKEAGTAGLPTSEITSTPGGVATTRTDLSTDNWTSTSW